MTVLLLKIWRQNSQ